MSDFVAVESIKDALAECPICTEYFNDTSLIPRRMPCCLQAMCESCLETYSQGRRTLSCPLCRQQHNLPGGVKSLPNDMTILRFLDVLKTQRNAVPSCTDCPDNNTAIAKCDTCSIYLCQPCLSAHSRNRMSRNHKTTTFEEIKNLRLARSQTVVHQKKVEHSPQVKQKLESIGQRIEVLSENHKNIEQSKKVTLEQINFFFDDLIAELQQRRGVLLSQAESKAEKEQKSILRALESHKSLNQKLQKATIGQMTTSALNALLEASPDDVEYRRRGVSFMEDNKEQLTSIIRTSGLVRTITFMPHERLNHLEDDSPCDVISLEHVFVTKASGVALKVLSLSGKQELESTCFLGDQVLLLQSNPIICPDIKFDTSFSNDDITVSESVIRNSKPDSMPRNNGCRVQSRRAVFSKPFTLERNQRCLYLLKVRFKLRRAISHNYQIWDVFYNTKPHDLNGGQLDGFGIQILSSNAYYEDKDYMCLSVRYNKIEVYCEPIVESKAGTMHDLCLAVLLNSEKKTICVMDVLGVRILTTVHLTFDQPMWTSMYIGREINSELKIELMSGNRIHLSADMMALLMTM